MVIHTLTQVIGNMLGNTLGIITIYITSKGTHYCKNDQGYG